MADEADTPTAHIAWWPLLAAIAITLAITIDPRLITDDDGIPDRVGLMLLCWAMCAGFVRGVGFIPRLYAVRWLLSGSACAIAVLLALWRLY